MRIATATLLLECAHDGGGCGATTAAVAAAGRADMAAMFVVLANARTHMQARTHTRTHELVRTTRSLATEQPARASKARVFARVVLLVSWISTHTRTCTHCHHNLKCRLQRDHQILRTKHEPNTQVMAKVHVVNVVVLDNPSPFLNPFQFEITFECIEDLKEDLEWKIIYVGSAESEEYDQTLDTVYVGPVPEGRHMFLFKANAPDATQIPVEDAVGVTVVLLSCSYKGKEFLRVGYYVNNEYVDAELRENAPAKPLFDKLQRNILATNPRVTRFKIDWD